MQEKLLTAIKQNEGEQLQELLNTATDFEKANAALLAAYANKPELLQLLIANGANINQVDKEGWTCLHWAVHHPNLDLIKLLMAHGAKNQEDNHGITPAHIAERKGYTDAFQLLVQHFFVQPFKPIQEELVDADAILEEAKQRISADTLNLLIKFRIKKHRFGGY